MRLAERVADGTTRGYRNVRRALLSKAQPPPSLGALVAHWSLPWTSIVASDGSGSPRLVADPLHGQRSSSDHRRMKIAHRYRRVR